MTYRALTIALSILAASAPWASAHAAALTCTQTAPCSLAELLVPGNSLLMTNLVYAANGQFLEKMQLSNFQAPIGDFGGASIAVWGETSSAVWQLVMEPNRLLTPHTHISCFSGESRF